MWPNPHILRGVSGEETVVVKKIGGNLAKRSKRGSGRVGFAICGGIFLCILIQMVYIHKKLRMYVMKRL